MALISCSECGKQISDKAAGTAQAVEVTREGTKYEALGFLIFTAGTVWGVWGHFHQTTLVPGVLVGLVGLAVFVVGRLR